MWLLVIIFLALSTEIFSVLFLNGFVKEAGGLKLLQIILIIILVQTVILTFAFFTGIFIDALLSYYSKFLLLGILFLTGLKMLLKSFSPKLREMTFELNKMKVVFFLALATGVNIFLAGLVLPVFEFRLPEILYIFGSIFLVSSVTAIICGRVSKKYLFAGRIEFIGSLIIIAISVFKIFKQF